MTYDIIGQLNSADNVLFSAEKIFSSLCCLINRRTASNIQEAFPAIQAGPRPLLRCAYIVSPSPAVAALYPSLKLPCLRVSETFPEPRFLKDKDHTHVYIPERVVGIF